MFLSFVTGRLVKHNRTLGGQKGHSRTLFFWGSKVSFERKLLISGPGLSVSSWEGFLWVGELREAQGHVCSGRVKESMPFPTRWRERRACWEQAVPLDSACCAAAERLWFPGNFLSLLHSSTAVPGPTAISYSCPMILPPVGFKCCLFTRSLSASLRRGITNSCFPALSALRPRLQGWVSGHVSFLSSHGAWVTAEHIVATHQTFWLTAL